MLLLLCLALVGAGGAQAQQGGARDTVMIGLPLEPPSLDPTSGAAAAVDEVVYGNLFEGLTRIAEDGTVQPALARTWTVSPDGLVYLFRLRPGVRFHDGSAMDAGVVKFSLDRARAPASTNAQKALIAAIASVDVVDPLTVRITLSRPYGALLSVLGWGDMVMVHPLSAATNAARPVGTGPFRFGGWDRGTAVRLVRFDGYWGARPALSAATLRFFADPSAAYTALRSGDLDAFTNYSAPENVAEFRADPGFRVTVGASARKMILAMNNARPPFNSLLVRRAVSHALNREAIIRGAMFGFGTPIGSHFSPADPAYVDLTGAYRYDPARARRLLAEAGYPNGVDVVLRLPPRSYARRSGEMIAAQLGAVGIRTRIENIEWSQWLDQVFGRRDFDLTVIEHVEPADYDIYARPGYYFGYSSPAYNALLARLDAAVDPAERTALLQAVQRHLARDAVNGFLLQEPRINIKRAGVEGLWTNEPIAGTVLAGVRLTGPAAAATGRDREERPAASILGPLLLLVGVGLLVWLVVELGPVLAARRLAVLAATLLAGTVVIFALLQVLPGDPARYMMGLSATPEAIAALRSEMGLDGTPVERYFGWLWGMLHGDFGTSYTYRVPVGGLLLDRLAVSLPLSLGATLLSLLLAFPLGLLAAAKRRTVADSAIMTVTQAGIAVPNFWFAMLLVLFFSITLRWLPSGGFSGWSGGVGDGVRALLLPAVALAMPQAAILARVLRSALLDTMHEDYVRSARAKGLSRGQALRRHALRNALIPVLSTLGLQIPYLLAGAIIIENVFSLPGLGRLVFQAITQRDLIVVQGVVVVLVFAATLMALVIDTLYVTVDPRLARRAAR